MVAESIDGEALTWYVRGGGLIWSKGEEGVTTYLYNGHGDVVATVGANEHDYRQMSS